MVDALEPVACRLLGCLMEKAVTVPATYPMTLNALVGAANQTSGRDPIMSIDAHQAEATLDHLREAGYVRRVHASHGARVVKYRHVADEVLSLEPPGAALIALLLLRGPQTPGELRSRSARLHDFGSVDEIISELSELSSRTDPLVVELARRPGQKEQRWSHLLGGPMSADAVDRVEPANLPGDPADPGARDTAGASQVPVAIEVGPEVERLAAFAGRWSGEGAGSYPTIEPFGYRQEIELLPVAGKPFLTYRSSTWDIVDGRGLHAESGFVRCIGSGSSVEMVIAQGSGLVEVAEGRVDDGRLTLTSTLMGASRTAMHVRATERLYSIDGDELSYDIRMAAAGEPLTHHLRAVLTRR